MTRDEAIKIWEHGGKSHRNPCDFIDDFVALGMLKLDESKSVEEVLFKHLTNAGLSRRNLNIVRGALEYHHLGIVEK